MVKFRIAPLLVVEHKFAQWLLDEPDLLGAPIPCTEAARYNFRDRIQTQLDRFAINVHLDYQLTPSVIVTYAMQNVDISVEWASV